ncbi:MAG: imidazoleglycerol-phosphate dehydratase HisB [Oscillospiraceae bacterium]|jgi:imidazoleglycerol-phosphate dehydratase|nr:imidazoleglycerol-phosphate dehydratase HisB [Oscillospiraceae bacterium]
MDSCEAEVARSTSETEIKLYLRHGPGESDISTGIGFFDHMLAAFFLHGGFSARLSVKGDLRVDGHHTVEDAGIAIGSAIRAILDKRPSPERFAHAYIPMDEALAFCAADCGGRAYLRCEIPQPQERVGDYDTCLTPEFFRALTSGARVTLHITAEGDNAHHITEAVFKAAGRAVGAAMRERGGAVPSTKGSL